MAHLFRPIAVKPIPASAERQKQGKILVARWKSRNGEWVVAPITESGDKCRVRSPYWWIEWHDANGLRHREKSSKRRSAATARMGDIVRDVERERGGLAPMSHATTAETLRSLAEEYRNHLQAQGRAVKHYEQTFKQIVAVAKEENWIRIQDVTVGSWSRWVNRQTAGENGISAETVNHYLRSLRGLFRWLIRSRRLGADPLSAVGLLSADADRRVKRRVLSAEDFRRLVDVATASRKVYSGLDGKARAALYLTAARTGLRAGTLAKLKREDMRLDDAIPHIPTMGSQQKSGREHKAPLSGAVVKELRAWVESREIGSLLWPGKWHSQGRGSRLIRWDLAEADIPEVTPDGTFDFHALRGQCGTELALAGVPLAVAQKFLGHSTPTLTAKYYVRVGLADLAEAANQLGSQLGQNSTENPRILASRSKKSSVKKARKKQEEPRNSGKR